MVSCQQNADLENEAVGYVCLNVETVTSTVTRALDKEGYNPKQLAVTIVNEQGQTIEQTDDYTEWVNKNIELPVGTYTITASSNGFDGNDSGFDIPYYCGSKTVSVGANTQQTVNVTCTLATVKVSVSFTERFKTVFSKASVKVISAVEGISPLAFEMGKDFGAGYFPIGNLSATISATSNKGSFSSTKIFENVQARDHFMLTYDVAASGSAQITIKADNNGNVYTYTLNISDLEQVLLTPASQQTLLANTFSNHTTLEGTFAGVENFNLANAYFEYKPLVEDSFTRVPASESVTRAEIADHHLFAVVEGLTPKTGYEYRLVYYDGEDIYTSVKQQFETEEQVALYNGNMDAWYQRPASGLSRRAQWFACSVDYFTANGTWWDSSNRGTTEGAGWLANKNPTTEESSIVHTTGGKSAKLASTSAVGVFAAASLYAGSFNSLKGTSGAKLDWGRPFTSRPKSLHGWFQYKPGTIDIVGNKTPASAGVVKDETTDLCSAYIALMHIDTPNSNGTALTVDNTDMTTFPDWENDPRVVAYAALPDAECVNTNGEWKEFNLELNYHKSNVKPTHIIIVFAASKYGDYFTGSTKTVLYLDDLELAY